ncbi:MAG: 50S ribosomal protein L2 [Candidatus Kerfeldbacteria bacterium]|nr:50S ribosomal protein L2 [Candidatus Kerfeldbacteria bacterium]
MPVKRYHPNTPGRRFASVIVREGSARARPFKRLLRSKIRGSGRNNQGKITVRHRGGGAKRHYRVVDFIQEKYDIPARVVAVEYDPNRTADIAHVVYRDGEHRYMLAPNGLKVGDAVLTSQKQIPVRVGNRLRLEFIPSGIPVSNVELVPGQGGKIVRSAGASATIMALDGDFAQLKIPSGEIRMIGKNCLATVGEMSNGEWRNIRLGKAGRMRQYGIRPRVRGKAMNPVDHRHGGGEGNQPIGLRRPVTPWGKPALGVRTRRRRKYSNRFIMKRRGSSQTWGQLSS